MDDSAELERLRHALKGLVEEPHAAGAQQQQQTLLHAWALGLVQTGFQGTSSLPHPWAVVQAMGRAFPLLLAKDVSAAEQDVLDQEEAAAGPAKADADAGQTEATTATPSPPPPASQPSEQQRRRRMLEAWVHLALQSGSLAHFLRHLPGQPQVSCAYGAAAALRSRAFAQEAAAQLQAAQDDVSESLFTQSSVPRRPSAAATQHDGSAGGAPASLPLQQPPAPPAPPPPGAGRAPAGVKPAGAGPSSGGGAARLRIETEEDALRRKEAAAAAEAAAGQAAAAAAAAARTWVHAGARLTADLAWQGISTVSKWRVARRGDGVGAAGPADTISVAITVVREEQAEEEAPGRAEGGGACSTPAEGTGDTVQAAAQAQAGCGDNVPAPSVVAAAENLASQQERASEQRVRVRLTVVPAPPFAAPPASSKAQAAAAPPKPGGATDASPPGAGTPGAATPRGPSDAGAAPAPSAGAAGGAARPAAKAAPAAAAKPSVAGVAGAVSSWWSRGAPPSSAPAAAAAPAPAATSAAPASSAAPGEGASAPNSAAAGAPDASSSAAAAPLPAAAPPAGSLTTASSAAQSAVVAAAGLLYTVPWRTATAAALGSVSSAATAVMGAAMAAATTTTTAASSGAAGAGDGSKSASFKGAGAAAGAAAAVAAAGAGPGDEEEDEEDGYDVLEDVEDVLQGTAGMILYHHHQDHDNQQQKQQQQEARAAAPQPLGGGRSLPPPQLSGGGPTPAEEAGAAPPLLGQSWSAGAGAGGGGEGAGLAAGAPEGAEGGAPPPAVRYESVLVVGHRMLVDAKGEQYTVYRLEVQDNLGRTWQVLRRFSEFVLLKKGLLALQQQQLKAAQHAPHTHAHPHHRRTHSGGAGGPSSAPRPPRTSSGHASPTATSAAPAAAATPQRLPQAQGWASPPPSASLTPRSSAGGWAGAGDPLAAVAEHPDLLRPAAPPHGDGDGGGASTSVLAVPDCWDEVSQGRGVLGRARLSGETVAHREALLSKCMAQLLALNPQPWPLALHDLLASRFLLAPPAADGVNAPPPPPRAASSSSAGNLQGGDGAPPPGPQGVQAALSRSVGSLRPAAAAVASPRPPQRSGGGGTAPAPGSGGSSEPGDGLSSSSAAAASAVGGQPAAATVAPPRELSMTVRLVLEPPPGAEVPDAELLRRQGGACAGCKAPLARGLGHAGAEGAAGAPAGRSAWRLVGGGSAGAGAGAAPQTRRCWYTGRVYCGACHRGDSSFIPALVLHQWDLTPRPVCSAAAEYLAAVKDQPLLCVPAINPGLYTRVPALAAAATARRRISQQLAAADGVGGALAERAASIRAAAGLRGYLLAPQLSDWWALLDLVDLSLGAFAKMPGWLERTGRQTAALSAAAGVDPA